MSQITYAAFTDRMISKYEGGYGWNKKDPGGPTKYGITCFDLAEHTGQKMDSMARWAPIVQAMSLATAEQIYKAKYAAAIRYDDLPAGPDACMEDYAVNSGVSRAIRSARAILKLSGSGMDQALLDAIKKTDPKTFVHAMCAERLHFMHAIRGGEAWKTFGGGWGARVADLQAYCDHLVLGGAAPVAPELAHFITPKAINTPNTAGAPTAGGIVGGAAATYAAGGNWYVVGGIVVGVLVAGVIYEIWQQHKSDKANNAVVLPPVPLPVIPAIPAAT